MTGQKPNIIINYSAAAESLDAKGNFRKGFPLSEISCMQTEKDLMFLNP